VSKTVEWAFLPWREEGKYKNIEGDKNTGGDFWERRELIDGGGFRS
jgi:hypothetical protein